MTDGRRGWKGGATGPRFPWARVGHPCGQIVGIDGRSHRWWATSPPWISLECRAEILLFILAYYTQRFSG